MLRLNDIQGNIVKPFKRKHGRFIFFEARGPDVREPLSDVLLRNITTAEEQADIADGGPDGTIGMAGLSGAGFARLQLPAAVPEIAGDPTRSFAAGLKEPRYWNPRPEHWEQEYLSSRIDGFLFLADEDPDRLHRSVSALETDLAGIARIVHTESVKSLRDAMANEYEHFGFRDDMTKGVHPKRVLLHETWSDHGEDPPLGCFAVVLKIEQHADRFEAATRGLAAAAGDGVTSDDVAERIIGRRRSGEPLVDSGADPDTFSFTGTLASRCPYQAHIRVMNPRDGGPEPIIIRRGMAYDRGLMFVSLHRSLMDFTSLMFRAEFARDPILSTTADWTVDYTPPNGCVVGRQPGQKWEINGKAICYPVANLTTLRGGEYFYIPSLTFLRAFSSFSRS